MNAAMLRDTLSGTPGAVADALALNAGVALNAAGFGDTVEDSVQLAMVSPQPVVRPLPLLNLAASLSRHLTTCLH